MIFENIPLDWVALSVAFVAIFYAYLTWHFGYWKKHNLPFIQPKILFGNYAKVFLGRTTVGELMENLYKRSEGKSFAGFWRFRTPGLLVRDPEVIRTVLLKEFNNFQENGFTVDSHLDPLVAKNPFFQTGDRWRSTRSILSPNFTSGKLKPMYSLMQGVSSELVDYLRKTEPGPNGFEAKNLASMYTMEMVATCGFGIKGNSFVDANADLKRMARRVLEPGFIKNLEFLLMNMLPFLGSILKVRLMPLDVDSYYRKLVSEVVGHRQKTGAMRNDYLQNLINIKKKSMETGETYDDEDIIGHTVTFLIEGFETSSITMSFCMHELVMHPEFQEGIRREIAEARQAANGELTYDALLELPLLDQVLQETLRVHVPLMAMEKVCTQDTTLHAPDGTAVRVPKGMLVVIPVRALHFDPRFHEDPERFDPGRWAPDRKENLTKYTYLPFGEGPRMCLGMRFANLQIKLALASILENFQIERTPRTPKEVKQDPTYFLCCSKDGLWVKFTPLKTNACG